VIADNRGDMKKLWRTFSAVTGSRATSQSAGAGAGMHKAEDFAKFFNDKIAAVREDTNVLLLQRPSALLRSFSHHGVQLHRLKWKV